MNHHKIHEIKNRLWLEVEASGESIYSLVCKINAGGKYQLNYNTVRKSLSLDNDAVNLIVIVAICDHINLDTNYILFG